MIMGHNVTFENEDVKQYFYEVIKKYNFRHVNWENDTVITFEDVESLKFAIKNIGR